jgi:hypothetical protein
MTSLLIRLPDTIKPPEHLDTEDNVLITVSLTDPDIAMLLIKILEAAEQLGFVETNSGD